MGIRNRLLTPSLGFAIVCLLTSIGAAAQEERKINTTKLTKTEVEQYTNRVEGRSGTVPTEELTWGLFTLIEAMEDNSPTLGIKILEVEVGLPAAEAEQLFWHIRKSIDQMKQMGVSEKDEICRQRQEITTRQQVASKMNELDNNLGVFRDQAVSAIPQFVSPESHRKISEWVELRIKPNYKAVSVDYDQFVEVTRVEPSSLLSKMCDAQEE